MAAKSLRLVLALSAVVLVALAVRLAWSSWTTPVPPRHSDAEYYHAVARSLADGQGYSVAFSGAQGFTPGGDASAFWPPGFSAFLAVPYRLFGESLTVARIANAIAGSVVVVPLYFVGRRLFSHAAGLAGAGIGALLPSLVFWTPVLLSETLFTTLFAAALALLLSSLRSDASIRPPVLVAAALVTGLAALVRGQALILIPVAVLWWLMAGARPRTALVAGLATVAAAVVVLAPWVVRNSLTMDSPVVLSTNLGYNLRVGHAPYSTGRYTLPRDLWRDSEGRSFQEREVRFNELGLRRAREYATHHPEHEVELVGRKIMWLWRPDSDVVDWVESFGATPLPEGGQGPLRMLVDSTYFGLLALVGAAPLVARGHARGLLFAGLLIAAWTAIHVVFFSEPRYHLPALAVLAPAAGVTLVWAGQMLVSGSWRR